jgi:carboxylesterase type B
VISEDCLYLNLFKPANSNNKTPLLVFVHGGGYKTGTDSIHSLDYMAENYVTKGIIYVTVHYRLGIMGYNLT